LPDKFFRATFPENGCAQAKNNADQNVDERLPSSGSLRKSCTVSLLKVENVLNPPQKPTDDKKHDSGCRIGRP
jgi:hypothetical protein